MSSGYCVDDVLALIQLSWSAVEGARRGCGKHDDLTKEVSSLYDILAHVYSEMSTAGSSIGRARRSLRDELYSHMAGCGTQLRIITSVLDKFNALSPDQRFGKQLWPTVRTASGRDQSVAEIRTRMATYSTAIAMSLRLMSLGSRGGVERELSRQKDLLKGIRESVNLALAKINSTTRQKSVMKAYSNDSKAFWSRLRREILKDKFSRSAVDGKKNLILSYMKELDSRGVLGYSTSFQKSIAALNEERDPRRSYTPGSFKSSSTLTGGRESNSSFHSFDDLKDAGNCSPNFDAPICIRTNFDEQSWQDSRPATAVEHQQDLGPILTTTQAPPDEQYYELPEPALPYSVFNPSSYGSKTLCSGPIDIATKVSPCQGSSPRSSPTSLSRSRSRSTNVEQKIKLEDPHGREFSFPLSQAKTWSGMETLIKKNCANMGSGIVSAQHDGQTLFPYLWEEMAKPGAKLTIRRPCAPSQTPFPMVPSEEFYLLPERPVSPEEEGFAHLPTLGDWIKSGRTEFTPHSEFYEMDV